MPDASGVLSSAPAMPFEATQAITYPSGWLFLAGNWAPEEITIASVGAVRVAVIGICPVTASRLSELAARVSTLADADQIAAALPGSFHLITSVDGRVRVQGSVSGLRRVFHARVDGVPVASGRPDILARMMGAGIDDLALATRVACGPMPPPLGGQSMWSGVRALPAGHYLEMRPTLACEKRWWQPPEPELPLTQGSTALRDALCTAMTGRWPAGTRVSADMSGGMDSTSLSFLAARDTSDLMTFRWEEADAGNDDVIFASYAIQALRDCQHIVVPQDSLPTIFSDPAAAAGFDGPYVASRTVARIRHTARLVASRGSRWHLAGHGGDEVFGHAPGYLHGLVRRHPVVAIRHARGYRVLGRWRLAATVAGLTTGGGTVADWWHAQADQLTADSTRPRPALGWEMGWLRAPAWVTPDAIEAARSTLHQTARQARPLAPDRGQHQILSAVRASAVIYDQLAEMFAESNVVLDMPYLDDRVLEAALRVRLHERANPWQYKRLLAEAMRGIVPDTVLGRSTKGVFGEDVRVGLRRNLSDVLDVFADSALAARGLIDPDVLRSRLLSAQATNETVIALEFLLGCETWLRAVTTPPDHRSVNALPAIS
jgi:asparagine synthase (glutamine-hydrolysing)